MELTGLHLRDQTDTPEYYLWEVPDKAIAIRLHYQVMDRMLLEVMRGFGLVPKRGVEVGGLLLGSIEAGEKLSVKIDDFDPVPCEHSRGPSYQLSEADQRLFEAKLESRRTQNGGSSRVVGFYRSHTREGLTLAAEDLALLQARFPNPSDVALLIKPSATRVSIAGFFFREDGQFQEQSYLEFPFRRRELGGPAAALQDSREPGPPSTSQDNGSAAEGDLRAQILEDAATPPLEEIKPIREARKVESAKRPRSIWIPLSFIFLLLGTLLGFQAAMTLRSRTAPPQAQAAYALALRADRTGDSLHVQWDRQALAVRDARHGLLLITDGDFKKTVELDGGQLQNGSVIYRHISDTVVFRLEIYPGDHNTVVETIEVRR